MYFISRWQHTQQNTGGHFILDCIRHRSNGYSRHPVLQNDEKGTVRFRQGYHLLKTSATKRATLQSISSFISTIFSSFLSSTALSIHCCLVLLILRCWCNCYLYLKRNFSQIFEVLFIYEFVIFMR